MRLSGGRRGGDSRGSPRIPDIPSCACLELRVGLPWVGSGDKRDPQAQPCTSNTARRFLRDYDGLFPVADDISLLQQASSLLYPLTTALG